MNINRNKLSALNIFIARYYTNLLAGLHTKIPLEVISVLPIMTTYFHPNYTESESYTLQPWSRVLATGHRVSEKEGASSAC